MNVIPTAPAPPVAPVTNAAGVPAEGTDTRLADAFAALVDALTAQVEGDAVEGEALDDAAELAVPATVDADAPEASTGDLAAAPALVVWHPPRTAPTAPVTDPTATAEGAAPELLVEPAPADASLAGDALTGDAAAEAVAEAVAADVVSADVEATSPDGEPDTTLPTAEQEPATEGGVEPAPEQGVESDAVPPDAAPLTSTGSTTTGTDSTDGQAPSAVGPTGSAPVRPAGEVAATAQAAATRAPAPTLPDQLVEVIGPLRQAPDGTHRVSVQLRPDELGEVLVDVRVRGNEVSLSIRADLAGTADLLRDAVGELRAELEAAGFRSGDVDVSSHHDRRAAQDEAGASTATGADRAALDGAEPDAPNPHAATSSGLDVRL